ncbi:terpene synthase 10-like isoform X1 [Zingiber officinale]|uniref:terpene synthase 10-like isoform X1 n=1 Tax=Zingiber officinale TaxID=94328 RepID=UPI001C4B2F15|nr:terpene synthase 10-like isoform X1 [Zingiber officinale]
MALFAASLAPLNLSFDRRPFFLRRCATTVIRCAAEKTPASRRSAIYQPNLWGDDRIRSLTVEEEDRTATARIKLLKEKVRKVIHDDKEVEEQLQLIDQLQQLGVAYHFKDDIKDSLSSLHASLEDISLKFKDNLHASAVLFRLLRENGFSVSEDIFYKFRDEKGQLRDCLGKNTQGMLSLYEASYYEKDEEMALHEAMEFATEHLKNVLEEGMESSDLTREKVAHALELPLNWRMERLHTRWFIESCQREAAANVNRALLEFAKLDFNATQSVHKKELRQVSRWWTELGIARELPFSRDRLTENYLWTVGWASEPEHWRFREEQTKANCFVTMIDDVYDVYGTLDELELFTDTIDRWDINAIDGLPDYMKLLFLAVFNTTNEATLKVMKEKGLNTMPYLKRAWADLCKAYLVEAKWYHKGHTPKFDEYLENGRMSISSNVMVTYGYCMAQELTKHDLERFSDYPAIMLPKSRLARLYDDLATSKDELKRGDVQKCIQCCMLERGVSEDVARGQMKEAIKANWRSVNGDRGSVSSSFEEYMKRLVVNMIRTFQFFYQDEDRYGKADGETENQVFSLLINPILL